MTPPLDLTGSCLSYFLGQGMSAILVSVPRLSVSYICFKFRVKCENSLCRSICPLLLRHHYSHSSCPGILDGLNLATDLLRGKAVKSSLADDNEDGEESCQSQHGRLKLPEQMFFHENRAAAFVLLSAGLAAVHSLYIACQSAGQLWLSIEVAAAHARLRHHKLLQQPAGGGLRLNCCNCSYRFLLTQQSCSEHPEWHKTPEQGMQYKDAWAAAGDGDPTVTLHQSAAPAPQRRRHAVRFLTGYWKIMIRGRVLSVQAVVSLLPWCSHWSKP